MSNNVRLIALYLPQFHPIPENDEWWAKGFTEWTNVGKAIPLFKNHYQPRVPTDLGYYDLRVPETRKAQADMAKEYGIEGFCYWHYWFGNGKRLLERPFKEVLETGEPDFPFCLGWANHSWKAKTWIADGKDKLLIKQTYNGIEDYTAHFYEMLPAFKDSRYIRIENKPFFLIWDPNDMPDASVFINHWNKLATENGLEGIHFVASTAFKEDIPRFLSMGFNNVSLDLVRNFFLFNNSPKRYTTLKKLLKQTWLQVRRAINGTPKYLEYQAYVDYFLSEMPIDEKIFPSVVPNFDHSPRSGKYGSILLNDSPRKFEQLLYLLFDKLIHKKGDSNIVILRSWNEWGEGNYLEPDLKNGLGSLEAIKKVISQF